jgi:hypothetical protein
LDDLLGFSNSAERLLSLLRKVFVLCRDYNLKLSASKCCFFISEALWCGNIYSSTGISPDPKRIALQYFPIPVTAGELMQFVCAATWLSSSIPDFARKAAPLRQLLEECLLNAPVRSKKFASRIVLFEVGWTSRHADSFLAIVDSTKHAVTLAYPSEDLFPCLFTDASKDFWMIVITQVPVQDLHLPFEKQSHLPLAFCFWCFQRLFRKLVCSRK